MTALCKYLLLCGVMLCFFQCLLAQENEEIPHEDDDVLKSSFLTIRNIFITGNRITKGYIIEREVPLKKNNRYSISDILKNLPRSRQSLINTGLFIDVTVDFTNWFNDSLDVLVDVKERWYFFPVPYFKPVDRNFNVWIKDYDASLSRVNYGIKLIANNVSGRNDKLNIWLITGYSRQVLLNYVAPYFDKTLKNGMGIDFQYSQNKEVNYTTENNKQIFYKDENNFVTEKLRVGVGYSYRTGYIKRHSVALSFNANKINDSVLALNPDYFGNNRKEVRYPELGYQYQNINVNYIPYPLRGFQWEVSFLKRGLSKNMNLWEFSAKAGKYWELFPKYYFSWRGKATLKLPFDQPYFNQQMMGYGDMVMRGLDYYVVDGVFGGLSKQTLSREIWSPKLKTGLKSRSYGVIPFKFYIKLFGDLGYVYNENLTGNNPLNNRLLYTGGTGLDILSIYDLNLSLEYSFNQLGESGVFLYARLGF
ncbi:MAG TPA: POTRA domain-containing protein [Agriterribacter sp.]|nr:POTRA domain-containing protein [Agriterribacter sp.]